MAVNFIVATTVPSLSLQVAVFVAVFVFARALGVDSEILYSTISPFPKSTIALDWQVSVMLASFALAMIGKLKIKVTAAKIDIIFFIRILLSILC